MARVYAAWKDFRVKPAWRLIQAGVVAACFGLMVYVLVANWARIDFSTFAFRIEYFVLALAVGCIPVWMGALAWAEILRSIRPDIPLGQALKMHLLSIPMKYLPGGAFNQVSKAALLRRAGVSSSLIVLLIALDVGVVILTGLSVMTHILLAQGSAVGPLSPGLLAGAAVVLDLSCLGLPVLLFLGLNRKQAITGTLKGFFGRLAAAELIDVASWLSLGGAFWLLMGSVVPNLKLDTLPYAIVALIAALVVSLLAVFAPNGIGIREATMVMILGAFIPASGALAVSLISRVVFVGSELLSFLPLFAVPWIAKAFRHVFKVFQARLGS